MGIGHHHHTKSNSTRQGSNKDAGKQSSFFSFRGVHSFSHGGELRKKKLGRGRRPLSTKESLHVVFKVAPFCLRQKSLRAPQGFKLVLKIIEKYAKHFGVKIEQLSVQNDHIHLLIRSSRHRNYHHFFRVVAGQIAQRFEKEGLLTSVKRTRKHATDSKMTDTPQGSGQTPSLWKYRPFSRWVRSRKAYKIVRNYIQLNEKEALCKIKYQKKRLKGLSTADWQLLWA